MEQQTEKDFRFENDPQAEVFLLSEKTKEKAPSISASCSLWCTSRDSSPGPTDQEGKPPVRLNLWKFRVIVIFNQGNVIFHLVISALFVGFCSEKYPLHVLKPCKNRAETVHLLPDKLKSTSSDNDLTALVWVAILLFLVLAASQADWKASDLILSITRRFVLEKSNTARYGLYGLVVVSFCQQENNIKRKEKQMMKRIFTLIASIVLATSLLAVPCFAAEPEDLPAPQPGVTETEQPDGSDQPENPDRPSIQPCDAMPGVGDMG